MRGKPIDTEKAREVNKLKSKVSTLIQEKNKIIKAIPKDETGQEYKEGRIEKIENELKELRALINKLSDKAPAPVVQDPPAPVVQDPPAQDPAPGKCLLNDPEYYDL